MLFKRKKGIKAQVTIFVIVAILIVAGIVSFFFLRDKIVIQQIPEEFQPIEQAFLACIQETTQVGVNTLSQQGGYIDLPNFEPGSTYMPSSNMLDYAGMGIPYWYYISGNNIVKTQFPTKQNMQNSLSTFLDKNLKCDFSQFTQQGFEISLGEIKSEMGIANNQVNAEVISSLIIKKEEKSIEIKSHKTNIRTSLGSFYEQATKVYNMEKRESFLENYTIDILYNYAPVTGADSSCSPEMWVVEDVRETLKTAIENNFIFIKGNNFNYQDKELNNYFTVDFGNKDNVRFLYSKEWPTKIEVSNEKNGILIAEPIGNQQGMGILGFCFVNYHFVYDLSVPVLIQIYNDNEIFQFPVVVIIKGNKPRERLEESENFISEPEICKYKTEDVVVYTYDSYSNPVEADISFKCFNELCDLGKTEKEGNNAILEEKVPACVNGFLIANSEGYSEANYLISTNEESEAYIMLKKEYSVNMNILSNGRGVSDNVLLYFNSEYNSYSLYYPLQKSIKLVEGDYNITAYAYRDVTIEIPESKSEKCVDVPNGVLGLFGITKKQCMDVVIPAQELSNAVVGGGNLNQYITESELQQGNFVIDVGDLTVPKTIEELQNIYDIIDVNRLSLQTR
jgi:hypothetical protein